MTPLRYGIEWGCGFPYTVLVNIYATDGAVAVSHGGVEVGQGINTKVSVCTHTDDLCGLIITVYKEVDESC